MVVVVRAERKSPVLIPSSLTCLSHIPTVNLTAGCAIGCTYCYAVGYACHPGNGRVVLYGNTLEKLRSELAHKRTKPRAVYFSPSSDLFQPVPEVLTLGHNILEFLLSEGIGVAFLTKGRIPDNTMRLLLDHAGEVQAQTGIITLDKHVTATCEPKAASPEVRLEQVATLVAGGVTTWARLAPILPGLTDTPDALQRLFDALAQTGVKRAAASALFLRPGIIESLSRQSARDKTWENLLARYKGSRRVAVRAKRSSVVALPRAQREETFERTRRVAREYGIAVSVCACMNPDIAVGTCGIAGSWGAAPRLAVQERLFNFGEV